MHCDPRRASVCAGREQEVICVHNFMPRAAALETRVRLDETHDTRPRNQKEVARSLSARWPLTDVDFALEKMRIKQTQHEIATESSDAKQRRLNDIVNRGLERQKINAPVHDW